MLAKVAQVTSVRSGRRSFIILPIILPKSASVNEKETRKRERERGGERERKRQRHAQRQKLRSNRYTAVHMDHIRSLRISYIILAGVGPGVAGGGGLQVRVRGWGKSSS